MSTYAIQCYWEVSAREIVEADSEDAAIEKVLAVEYGLPEEPDYVDGSFVVERSLCEEIKS